MSLAKYSDLKDSDKQRLAAAFSSLKNKKSTMSKVNEEGAALDISPQGNINGTSFKTSINRMKGGYLALSMSDKNRQAACFTNMSDADMKSVMDNIDWKQAAESFRKGTPGAPIKPESFRTSVQRILFPKDNATGASAGKKRKAPATASPTSSSENTKSRKKKAKVSQAASEDDSALSATGGDQETTGEDLLQSAASSEAASRSQTPAIKAEEVDDAENANDEMSQHNPQFFPDD